MRALASKQAEKSAEMAMNLKKGLVKYFSNVWFLWALCLIFNIITFLLIFYKINPGEQNLTLHYNVIAGAELYGRGANLYLIPGIGLAILLANFILYKKLKGSEVFFAPLCLFITFTIEIILLVSTLVLASVN